VPEIIRCPNCGKEIDSSSRFCVHCTARICPGCHGPVPPRAVYCPHCGFAVGPALPGATEQQTTTPPRPFVPSQGGIIGRQVIQPQPPPPIQSGAVPDAAPIYPIPQAASPPAQYTTGDQYSGTGGYGTPDTMPSGGVSERPRHGLRMPSGPILAERFPRGLVIIIIAIICLGLLGFATFHFGWVEGPVNAIQEFASGIKMPQWLSFGPKDTTPPVISEVKVSDIAQTSAVITWQTDEPATSQVMICESNSGCTWTELDETLVTAHSVQLRDLEPNVTCTFTASSMDARENQATSEGELTTLSEAVPTQLLVSGVNISQITSSTATITWQTDKPATSQVNYGITTAYGSTTPLDEKLTTSHNIPLTGLQPNTTYHFRVESKDASGNDSTSGTDQTFTTLSTVPVSVEIGLEVGNRAPEFTLKNLAEKSTSLSQYRGKIVIVKFWTEQSSRNEMSYIQDFYQEWSSKGVEILAINWRQDKEQVQSFVEDKSLTFPILLDSKGEVATTYKVNPSSNPSTFFIDAQGIIKKRQDMPIRNKLQIEEAVKLIQSSP
jgi:peroxiredoxin